MPSTATETKKNQETSQQPTGNQGGAAQQSGLGTSGTSQGVGGSQISSSQQGTGQQSTGGGLSRSSEQGQGLSRFGSPGGLYFPSTAEFFSNPFGVMRRMHEEMDRAFAEAFSGGRSGSSSMQAWAPAIDVTERQGNLVVHAELPGVRPQDVQLEVTNDTLVISGSRERSEDREEQGGVHRRERMYGSFYREVSLPEGTNPDQARAEFNHGVLEITIPIPQSRSQSRRIEITSSEQSGTGSGSSGALSGSSGTGSTTSGSTASGSSSGSGSTGGTSSQATSSGR